MIISVHFLELPSATDHHPSADGIIPPVLCGRLPGITKTFDGQNGATSSSPSHALTQFIRRYVDVGRYNIQSRIRHHVLSEFRSPFVMGVSCNQLRHPVLHYRSSFSLGYLPGGFVEVAGTSVLSCQDLSPGESGNGIGHCRESRFELHLWRRIHPLLS